jgi:hypothetical protein
MKLSKVSSLKKQVKPSLVVDLSEFDEPGSSLSFREPTASDLFPKTDIKRTLKTAFPEFPEEMLDQIILMGSTVIAEEEEGELNPYRSFGTLARGHRDAFMHIVLEHFKYFQTENVEEKVTDLKNAPEG